MVEHTEGTGLGMVWMLDAAECPLCGKVRPLIQDHNHENGLRRDRICPNCNVILGRYDHPTEFVRKLMAYIEKWEKIHASGAGVKY